MADAKAKGSTDSTGNAQGRFTVALPADLGAQIDKIGERISKAVLEQTGVGVDLSRAQIVTSLVKSAVDRSDSEPVATV